MKNLAFIFSFIFLITSCGFKTETKGSHSRNFLSGIITPFLGSIASNQSSPFLISSANASLCASAVYAKLFRVQPNGSIDESLPLATVLVGSDARYSFDMDALGLTHSQNKVEYILQAEGCNDNIYKRPVTNFNSDQAIDAKTTIVAETVNINSLITKKLNETSRAEIQSLIDSLSGTSTTTALDSLINQTASSAHFTEIFGVPPTVLRNTKPQVVLSAPSLTINELAVNNFSAQSFHVDASYSPAYEWKLDGVVKSNVSSWSYTPGTNESGTRLIELVVGHDIGNGSIDFALPYSTKAIRVEVNNNILPVAPNFSLSPGNPSPVSSNSVQVNLSTGASLEHCESFTHMAISETATPPGIMQFNIDCTTLTTQTENIILSTNDGTKTLYLWAIDNEGTISSPKSFSLILDTLPPVANISFIPTLVKGGGTYSISLSASDTGAGLDSLTLYLSEDNGSTYTLVSALSVSATSYSWTAPAVHTAQAMFKLDALDLNNTTTTVYSSVFNIDSVAPVISSFTLAGGMTSIAPSSLTTSVAINSSDDGSTVVQMRLSENSVYSNDNWVAYAASGTNYSLIASSGSTVVYLWLKDDAGNISARASYNLVINNAPAVSNQNLVINENNTLNITFAGTDADNHSLAYTILANPSNGVLSGTLPNIIYTPTANYSGPDSFTFKVNDGYVDSATGTISINVRRLSLTLVSGNNQAALTATQLPLPLSVVVRDSDNNLISNATVTWSTTSGNGVVSSSTSTTNASGVASTNWTMGIFAGANTLSATTLSPTSPVIFTATAVPKLTMAVQDQVFLNTIKSINHEKRGLNAVVISDKIYVYGGINSAGSTAPLTSLWVYDPNSGAQGSWMLLNPAGAPPSVRSNFSTASLNNKLYLFGGIEEGFIRKNDLWVYDPSIGLQGTWSQLTPTGTAPVARYGHSADVYNGKMYIYAGVRNTFNGYRNDIHAYDPSVGASGRWSGSLTTANINRWHHASAVVGDRIYYAGGRTDDNLSGSPDHSCFSAFNPSTNGFSINICNGPIGNHPTDQKGALAFGINNKLHIFGGACRTGGPCFRNSLFSYDSSSGLWTTLNPTGPSPSATKFYFGAVLDNILYVFGEDLSSGPASYTMFKLDFSSSADGAWSGGRTFIQNSNITIGASDVFYYQPSSDYTPWTFSLTGGGSLSSLSNSGFYTGDDVVGSSSISLSGSSSQSTSLTIAKSGALGISVSSPTMIISVSATNPYTISGGIPPYHVSFTYTAGPDENYGTSASEPINGSGIYTAPNLCYYYGNDDPSSCNLTVRLQVKDSAGNTAATLIDVVP